jgi:CRISPR-associated endonuclease/helicase Cas3
MTTNGDWLMSALDASPFPWQRDLLHRFRQGEVVSSLDIPTGLGKTAVMAVWLVARALGAALPRRLVYVVDRRAVVDQATDVAESLRAWVANERGVADALGLDDRRLPISTLRGQYVDNRQWLEDPSSPAIVSKRLNSTKTLSVVDLANVAETRGGDGGRHGR